MAPKKDPPTTLPAVKAQPVNPLAAYSTGLPAGVHFASFPLASQEQQRAFLLELECAVNRLWDHVGGVLLVERIAITDGLEEREEDGELTQVKRLYLWTPAGIGYQTPSQPARQSLARQLARLAQLSPPVLPPYVPPLRVKIDRCPSQDRSKGDWLHLVVLASAEVEIKEGRP